MMLRVIIVRITLKSNPNSMYLFFQLGFIYINLISNFKINMNNYSYKTNNSLIFFFWSLET